MHTAISMKLPGQIGNDTGINHAIKFATWQHPAMSTE